MQPLAQVLACARLNAPCEGEEEEEEENGAEVDPEEAATRAAKLRSQSITNCSDCSTVRRSWGNCASISVVTFDLARSDSW